MIKEKLNRPNYSYVKFATDGQAFGYAELICDTVSNIASLPTSRAEIAIGSKCFCVEDGQTYILGNCRTWCVPGTFTDDSGAGGNPPWNDEYQQAYSE